MRCFRIWRHFTPSSTSLTTYFVQNSELIACWLILKTLPCYLSGCTHENWTSLAWNLFSWNMIWICSNHIVHECQRTYRFWYQINADSKDQKKKTTILCSKKEKFYILMISILLHMQRIHTLSRSQYDSTGTESQFAWIFHVQFVCFVKEDAKAALQAKVTSTFDERLFFSSA